MHKNCRVLNKKMQFLSCFPQFLCKLQALRLLDASWVIKQQVSLFHNKRFQISSTLTEISVCLCQIGILWHLKTGIGSEFALKRHCTIFFWWIRTLTKMISNIDTSCYWTLKIDRYNCRHVDIWSEMCHKVSSASLSCMFIYEWRFALALQQQPLYKQI